jgi:hypothetical protein
MEIQMAKHSTKPTVLSIDQPFPPKAALKSPHIWDSIIATVNDASSRRHSSLSKEFVWIFGLTSHHSNHHEDFSTFCRSRNIAIPKSLTPASILSTMLLQFTGKDRNGRKSASKYKNLILPSLKEGLSVSAFEKRIAAAGGVFGLAIKKTAKTALSKTMRSVYRITEDDEYWVSIPFGETYTVELKANQKPKTFFCLTVATEPDRSKANTTFSKAMKVIPLDDDENEGGDDR